MYCDAKRDMYRMIRKSEDFILASEGNYSGAVEQLTLELAEYKDQDTICSSFGWKHWQKSDQ